MAEGTVLKDIGSCKQRLLTAFVNNDDICELLFNKKPYTEEFKTTEANSYEALSLLKKLEKRIIHIKSSENYRCPFG